MKDRCKELINVLEETIDIIDMVEKEVSSLSPGDKGGGSFFRLYTLLIDLREKIVYARFIAVEECS